MDLMPRQPVALIVVVILITLFPPLFNIEGRAATPKVSPQAAEEFPLFPVIKPNVDFWVSIFAHYSKAQGVIHDARDLSRIYGVVALDTANTRAAAKKNRAAKKKAIKAHKAILLKLAKGIPPGTEKEKKIAAMFGKHLDSAGLKQAASNLRIQTGLKNQFKEGLIRSGAYIPEFRRIFRSHGLPLDLVYLPCVESSFNVNAYSKFGAAGIWQFTRSTGRQYMEIGYVVDQRRDPYMATQSAARLLKRNYGELKNWPMAITAYNHGLNGMKRAKKKHTTFPKIYKHYTSRSFKFASRNFYAEFLAAREVAINYQKYFGWIKMEKPIAHTLYQTKGYLPAGDLSQSLNLEMEKLKQLNPALRKPVFDGRKYIPKGFKLRLPSGISPEALSSSLAKLYKEKQKPSRFHRVVKGDTAGSIARTHKVSLNDLIMANHLNRRAVIYIGQTLRIPGQGEALVPQTALASAPAPAKKEVKPVKQKPKKEPVKQKPVEKKKAVPAPVPVKVEKKVSPEKAAEQPGPEKREPSEAQPATTAEPMPAKAMEPGAKEALAVVTADLKIQKRFKQNGRTLGIIHVVPEETLGHYADWLKIPTQTIRNVNRLTYGKTISIGQAIKIPLPAKGSHEFEEQRYEFHQEILEDFFDSYFVSGTNRYEIKSGDTLWDLCVNELEIPLWLLQKFNPAIDFNKLRLGQKLVYPLINPNGIFPQGTSPGPAENGS